MKKLITTAIAALISAGAIAAPALAQERGACGDAGLVPVVSALGAEFDSCYNPETQRLSNLIWDGEEYEGMVFSRWEDDEVVISLIRSEPFGMLSVVMNRQGRLVELQEHTMRYEDLTQKEKSHIAHMVATIRR